MPPLEDSDVADDSPRPPVDSDVSSAISDGSGCNSDGDSDISAVGAGDIPELGALGAATEADGGEVWDLRALSRVLDQAVGVPQPAHICAAMPARVLDAQLGMTPSAEYKADHEATNTRLGP